jgi:hypothetical protein
MPDVLADLNNPYSPGSFLWRLWVLHHLNVASAATATLQSVLTDPGFNEQTVSQASALAVQVAGVAQESAARVTSSFSI